MLIFAATVCGSLLFETNRTHKNLSHGKSKIASPWHCEISRHDHHNLEFKCTLQGVEGRVDGRADFYLLLPSTVKVRSWDKAELLSDFYCRMRLCLPLAVSAGETWSRAAEDFESALRDFIDDHLAVEDAQEALMKATQRFGAVAGETLKFRKILHIRRLLEAHGSRAHAPVGGVAHLASLLASIEKTAARMERMDTLVQAYGDVPYLGLARDYVHQLYVQYLAALHAALRQIEAEPKRFDRMRSGADWERLESLVDRLATEAAMSDRASSDAQLSSCEREREVHLLKFSHLKKFFQSNMFIEVSRQHEIKRFAEPVAAAAAGTAALWAAFFQNFQKSDMANVGFRGVYILCLGVMAYVLKDRLKDRGKSFLTRKVSKFVPDHTLELEAEHRPIGRVREWFRLSHSQHLPDDVKRERHRHRISEAEAHLQEDVLHFRQDFAVDCRSVSAASGTWAIQECLRLNLERYLKFLDDPYKDFTCLEPTGRFSRLQAHRVYYFHAVVRTTLEPSPGHRKTSLTFVRIVMDKTGIQRVDTLKQPLKANVETELQSPLPMAEPLRAPPSLSH